MYQPARLATLDPDIIDTGVIDNGRAGCAGWQSRQLALLAEFGEFSGRDGELEPVLQEACRVAAEGTAAPFAALLGYQPDERRFVLKGGIGWRPGAFEGTHFPADMESTAGLALHTGQSLRFGRSTFDGMMSRGYLQAPQALTAQNVRQVISVLVRGAAGTPFGVFEVGRDQESFGQTDITFLEAISNIVAAAVRNDAWRASCQAQAALADERLIQLRELRHRVGNDLQSVGYLAEREARACDEPQHRPAIRRFARHAMALGDLYKHLNTTQTGAAIDLAEHLRVLCVKIARTEELRTRQIAIDTELQPVQWNVTNAVRLAMAVKELVSNAVRHAFPTGTAGTIMVRLVPGEAGCRPTLSVSDNGCGFDGACPESQGLDIVRRLVAFAGAELSRRDQSGTTWTITLNPG